MLHQFALEYGDWVASLPHTMERALSRMQRPAHRALLQRSLDYEQGHFCDDDDAALRNVGISPRTVSGVPRAMLFRRFSQALGIADWETAEREPAKPCPAARQWHTRLLEFLDRATAAQALGALGLGTEHIVRPIYEQVLEGLLGLGSLRRDDFVFFELHCLVGGRHRENLLGMTKELAAVPGGIAELRFGMRIALQLRAEFWDHIYLRAVRAQLANPA
ncbi:MAG: iron-containing redox enzyme family protein [Planctomycetota bacterium]